jgi:GNAT superfamily N-acetyltransferase
VEPSPAGGWRVLMEGSDAPLSVHDTEEEARERLAAYLRGMVAAETPTEVSGVPRGDRLTLRDGSEVIVRAMEPEDLPLLAEGFERLGERSRYQRFLAPKKQLTSSDLGHLTDVDHDEHEAIGALNPADGHGVGVARFIRERPGGDVAEAAVAVVDDWQGRGLGGMLLERLLARAHEVGVTAFSASLLTDNRAMLALFARLGEMEIRHDEGGTVRIHVRLPADDDCLREALKAVAEDESSRNLRPSSPAGGGDSSSRPS